MQTMPTFVGLKAASSTIATRQVSVTLPRSSRQQLAVKASVMAEPATIDVKNLDGSSAGSAALSLRVADNETSKGLVHRYLVMVRQNARRVSILLKEISGSGGSRLRNLLLQGSCITLYATITQLVLAALIRRTQIKLTSYLFPSYHLFRVPLVL